MDVFKDRIKKIRGDLTFEQFAQELSKSGIPFGKGNVWRYENDANLNPSFGFFYAVAKRLNVNLNWLITGDGPMFINYNSSKSEKSSKMASETSKTPDRREPKTSKAVNKSNQ